MGLPPADSKAAKTGQPMAGKMEQTRAAWMAAWSEQQKVGTRASLWGGQMVDMRADLWVVPTEPR